MTQLVNNSIKRTRVKICGITRVEDALAAAHAGADAIGLVFYDKSPRAVTVRQAAELLRALPPFVSSVGLFVNADAASVKQTLAELPLDMLQFHGDETPEYCEGFAKPYLKAIRVKPDTYIPELLELYSSARGILLDAWHEDLYGGSGQRFDWSLIKGQESNCRIILAGGLAPDNVAEAIRMVSPWAVDVSSGVESKPGVKSETLISAFIHEVQRV